jgi:hypothetical protein
VYWLLVITLWGWGAKTEKAFSSVGEKAFQQHLKSKCNAQKFYGWVKKEKKY